MMNSLCMLCFLLDVDNLRDSGALADGIIMSGFLMYVMFGDFDLFLRVFDPGRLLGVRVGNLNELTKSKGRSTQAAYLW